MRVLIVDDHAVVRQGLRAFFESEGDIVVVGESDSGEDAVERARELEPDIVLLDLVMPEGDGISAIRSISMVSPNSRILVLTSFGDDAKVFPAVQAGAMGYLLKSTPAEDLSLAMRCVARGYLVLDSGVGERIVSTVQASDAPATSVASLTPREREVLELVSQGCTNPAIAYELGISVKTVKTHVSHILGKLEVSDRTQAAVRAVKQGIDPSGEMF